MESNVRFLSDCADCLCLLVTKVPLIICIKADVSVSNVIKRKEIMGCRPNLHDSLSMTVARNRAGQQLTNERETLPTTGKTMRTVQ